jgi:signal transduction histidine kinase
MAEQLLSDGWLFWGYVLVFGASALVCFASCRRTGRIDHGDTRRGLYWLLLASGGWATAHVGYLLAPTEGLQYALFVAGLVIGFAAVGPWLYFCSAYTGRSLHRNRAIRRFAVAVFVVVAAVKVTNPIHGAYFSVEPATAPFEYLAVTHGPLHWIVMGLAYALALVGFFMLLELFVRVNSDATPLVGLVGLTGVPVVLDAAGAVSPALVNVTHSPIGVALFSIGVLYVYLDRFRIVKRAGESDEPVVILDDGGVIRDFNGRARELFPALEGSIGDPFEATLPRVEAALGASDPVFEATVDGTTRYYSVSSTPLSPDRVRTGRIVVLTDITERERYRQKLERQNSQLDRFASIVSHDLRNPLSVAQGWTELAIEEDDTEPLSHVVDAHERMHELIEEILTLAREGDSIDELESLDLAAVAERSWEMITPESATLVVEDIDAAPIEADPERLQQLFENLFRNAVEHGSTSPASQTQQDAVEHGGNGITITVGELDDEPGFFVEDDGVGIPEDDRGEIFSPGYTTSEGGTGFGLAIVEEIAEAHGWEIRVTESDAGGARFEISGVGG